MVTATDSKLTGFVRSTFVEGGRTKIKSTCIHCGEEIVARIAEDLPQLEADHLHREHGGVQ